MKLDTWEKEGQKHSKLRVVCDRMQMIGARGEGGGHRPSTPAAPAMQHHDDYAESRPAMVDHERDNSGFTQDEIPF